MNIGAHRTGLHTESSRAPQNHVLADGRDEMSHRFGHGLAIIELGLPQGLDVAGDIQRRRGDLPGQRLEAVIARDKVGLRVEFDHRPGHAGAIRADGDRNHAFGGYPVRFLGGFRQPLGAQPIDGGFHVAMGLLQRLLAVHHADARLFAQRLDQGGGNLGHGILLDCQWRAFSS